MHKRWLTAAAIVVIGTVAVSVLLHAAQPTAGEQFLGDWPGTWEGIGSGRFDLSFARSGARIIGSIAVDSGEGSYTVALQDLSFEGSKMSARYPYPFAEREDIVIAGDFGDAAAAGTWSLQQQDDRNVLYAGKWRVRKR